MRTDIPTMATMHTRTEPDSSADTTALQATLLLQTWLSPSFPTGAFSYSHGLETAIAEEVIRDGDSLEGWLDDLLMVGSLHNEAVLFSMAWQAADDPDALRALNRLAIALAGSAERHTETTDQARAFVQALRAWPQADVTDRLTDPNHPSDLALPIVAGSAMACTGLGLSLALASWLQAFIGNLVWIAVRLVPLGQAAGLSVIASLQARVVAKSSALSALSPDALAGALGSCSPVSDMAAMRHESLPTRLCLT